MRWVRHMAGRESKKHTQGYVRKCERKRPLGRPREGRMDNIKIYFKQKAYKGIQWIHLFRDKWWASVSTVTNFWYPKNEENLWTR